MTVEITKRAVLQTAATLAADMVFPSAARPDEDNPRVRLRMLETSDLHMFVLDWDYYRAQRDPTVGFARTATLIGAARAESVNTVLLDNGDFLQGNPLADFEADQPFPTASNPHSIVAIMNSLGYDAVGLGNHEFNYGLDFLEASLEGAQFPFVCANVIRKGGSVFLPPYTILKRTVKDTQGAEHDLRIGVIGFVTPQIMVWDMAHLQGRLESPDIVQTARHFVPELRKSCDLVVALSHSGIKGGDFVEGEENASFHLASVPGIDVIMTGHQHRVFPGTDYSGISGVDAAAGRLNGVPAVMPGFWGSHLGVIDLDLKREAGRWTVADAHVETRPIYGRTEGKVEDLAPSDHTVAELIAPWHRKTLAWVEQPVGTIDRPIQTYFVWAGYDPATAVVNAAQCWYGQPLLAKAGYGDLPMLSAAAPYRAGYKPDSFIDIKAGPVKLRQTAELYVFSINIVVAVKMTGAQIVEWLECAARIFNTIDTSASGPQALLDPRFPTYNFDVISGLTYSIDVTKPARYDPQGNLRAENRRISGVQHQGLPIDLDRDFIVLTNNFRADGGGRFPGLTGETIVLRAPDTNREAVKRYIEASNTVTIPNASPWAFAKTGRATPVYFDTGVGAPNYVSQLPGITILGKGEPGYLRAGFTLL